MEQPKKILVVDDDPVIQKIASETLRKAGYDVKIAVDGVQAMAALKADKPDLMVLDIMMPEMNGYDVCEKVKFDPDLKEIPIIVLSSRDQELDPRLGALMDIEYLHKSCTPKELVSKVNKIIVSRG
ncbi:MAG: response regulator [Candidatus Omnitrophica bacterium]|nr:response regulator [Candidatus Omnitrophota bacterium]